ncbi:MAG: chemotaxis protein CheB, partial [bacterium]|nr:chemotaxis protein CheB [bacterium]
RPFPLPIAVAQHMAEGFVRGFADWLADETTLPVVCVEEAVSLTPGTVYLPGEDCHLRLASRTRIIASTEQLDTHHRPSVDLLFDSAAQQFGGDSVAVLLTGMGRDGSSGLKTLHDADAFTIAQEPSSCAVDSMPRHAIEDGSACTVLVPGEIAPRITGYLKIDQV